MNDIRISGTLEDLQHWEQLLNELQSSGKIEILESSTPYKNRGDSKIYRQYIKVKIK
jgi:hypothetical protein